MGIFKLIQQYSYSYKGDRRFDYLKVLKKHLHFTRQQVVDFQNGSIKKLITHAYENTMYYKHLFDEHGIDPNDIQTAEDLKRIPAINKQIIRKNIDCLKSNDQFGQNLVEVTSGGTTGEQGLVYFSPYYMQMLSAFAMRNNYILGFDVDAKWAALRTVMSANFVKPTFRVKCRNLLSRVQPLNALAMSDQHYAGWVADIKKFEPEYILGFSSVILDFARYLIRNKIVLPSIKMVQSTSEVLREEELISKAFNCPVADQYGSREIQALGLRLPNAKNMMIYNDNVAICVNERNELLVTALHSFGFPLINYNLGDVVQLLDEKDWEDNGYPFQQINFQIGRYTDNFLTEDGVTVASSSIITHLAYYKLGVKEYQIVQLAPKHFDVNFIPDTELKKDFSQIITTCLQTYFGADIKVNFNKVEFIPLEKSGKRRMYKRAF